MWRHSGTPSVVLLSVSLMLSSELYDNNALFTCHFSLYSHDCAEEEEEEDLFYFLSGIA